MMGMTGKWGWRNDGDKAMTDETTGTRRRRGWQDDDEAPHHRLRVSTECFPHSHGRFSFLVLFVSSTKEYIYIYYVIPIAHISTTCK
jgi:transposase